ncbi:RNA polymerase sigma factor (sigma-70 family) [Pseudobacter ginsenosidimutans]|uniref:RNA polymerase sigma factor (Sigma-70 family) n=2 Tax=Pseudobacter ginsenosidimutans TaxID=661488 RepID=A0A4Q7N0Q4_9BACT|nr:RNA polymerase sigma factor (sigma-70 family) [Pseudobacter ginsenosidimutans]
MYDRWFDPSNKLMAELYDRKFRIVVLELLGYCDLGMANQIAAETFDTIYIMCSKGKQFPTVADASRYWLKIAIRKAQAAPDVKIESFNNEHHSHHPQKDYSGRRFFTAEEYNQLKNELRKIVENLPPKYKRVVKLSIYEKLRHKEIAALTGLKEATVRKHFERGKKMVGERINEHPSKKLLKDLFLYYTMIMFATLPPEPQKNSSKSVTKLPVFPFISIATTSRVNEHGKQS